MPTMRRRDVLTLGALGAGITAVGVTVPTGQAARTKDWISTSAKPARFRRPLPVPQPISPTVLTDDVPHVPVPRRADVAPIGRRARSAAPVLATSLVVAVLAGHRCVCRLARCSQSRSGGRAARPHTSC